jgi:hypothetical protein
VAADSGITAVCFSCTDGSERLHSALGANGGMTTGIKDWKLVSRLGMWCALQALFFVWVYPGLGHWIRRDTNVYFCFAAFALALVSVVVMGPASVRVSVVARTGFLIALTLACWEAVRSMQVLLLQF